MESEHSLSLEELKSLRSIREKLDQQIKTMEEELQKVTQDAEDSKGKLKDAIIR